MEKTEKKKQAKKGRVRVGGSFSAYAKTHIHSPMSHNPLMKEKATLFTLSYIQSLSCCSFCCCSYHRRDVLIILHIWVACSLLVWDFNFNGSTEKILVFLIFLIICSTWRLTIKFCSSFNVINCDGSFKINRSEILNKSTIFICTNLMISDKARSWRKMGI